MQFVGTESSWLCRLESDKGIVVMRRAVLVVSFVAVVALILWGSGGWHLLTDREALRAAVEESGAWAPLVYVALCAVAFATFLLSGPVWVSPLLWHWPVAFAYSYGACALASLSTYALARAFGHDWVQARLPPRLRRYEARLESHPFLTVIALRLLLWANPLVDMLLAVSEVPLRSYLAATLLGLLPTTAFQVWLGVAGLGLAADLPSWAWAVVAGLAALFAIRLQRRSRTA